MGGFYIKLVCCTKKTRKYSLETRKVFRIVVVKLLKNHSNRGKVVSKLGTLNINIPKQKQELFLNFSLLAVYVRKGAVISPTARKYILI